MFDVTFLESSWTCIYGQGCHGVLTGPADELVQGCCSYGAHFTGKKDLKRVDRRGGDPDRRAVAVQEQGPADGQRSVLFASHDGERRDARDPDRGRSVHLLEPSRDSPAGRAVRFTARLSTAGSRRSS